MEEMTFNEDEMGIIQYCLGHYAESGMEDLKGFQVKDLKAVDELYAKVFGRPMIDLEHEYAQFSVKPRE